MGTWPRARLNLPACFAARPGGPTSSDGEPRVLYAAKSAVEVEVEPRARELDACRAGRWKRGAVLASESRPTFPNPASDSLSLPVPGLLPEPRSPLRELPGRSEDIFRRSHVFLLRYFVCKKFKKIIMEQRSGQVWNHWVQCYHCEYKMRTGRKPDGCAICFKHSKFSLLSVNPVEFYRPDVPLLDRDNVGLVLLLQPKIPSAASPAICVANTHLLYNPRRGDIKLTQLAMLLAEISSVAHQKDGSFCPIVMCGDFNSVPGSPLYSFIKEGKLNYEGLPIGKVPKVEKTDSDLTQTELDKTEALVTAEKVSSNLQHHFSLSSVYSHYFPDTGIPEVTTCHSRSAITVDYIFYSAEKEDVSGQPGAEVALVGGLKLLARLSLLTEQDLWTVNGLPNENNSSDHLPLLAKFRLEL
ncbi:Protein angel-like protein 2 [Camelus dromedarius]|uniref:Protein angel-like protein 2 n=1 Tax=Camelus dromedarius TaxID=9838 RepID=A0A5N4CJG6_CAMDR|nr:Protein angel-like protein 2 [Camelus dromedarius]